MAGVPGQKHKLSTGSSQDEWTTRERLILASSVVRSGDQNWVSVSRATKPVAEQGCCARPRPPDFFSQKNCAIHYSDMLEQVSTPKRKRTNEGGGAGTPGDQIVRKLTFERIEELKKSIKTDHVTYRMLKARIEDIKNGKLDHQLQAMCDEIEVRRKRKEEMQNKGSSSQIEVDVTTPVTPTTPTPVMPPSGGTRQVMQPLTSPHKGKQQRIPKPTEKFQKYQQQQRQRHGHTSQQTQYPNQPSEGMATSPGVQSESLMQNKVLGTEQTRVSDGTQVLKRESTEMEVRNEVHAGNQSQPVTPTGTLTSPWRHEPGPLSPVKPVSLVQQSSMGSSQAPSESALLSLLSQPPKDLKQTVIELSEPEQALKKESEQSFIGGARSQPSTPAARETNSQDSDGMPFLGIGSSVEPKKLDSIRDRLGSTGQVAAAVTAAPSVSAPTLSKLLASVTTSGPSTFNASPLHTAVPKSTTVTKPSLMTETIGSVHSNSVLGRGGGGGITVGGQGEGGGASVTTLSFSPKAAVRSALPSPMAITPPPNTPPADKKEMITESLVQDAQKATTETEQQNSVTETASVKCGEQRRLSVASKDHGQETKVEAAEAVEPTLKIASRTRASKPGRPGRPPKAGRKPSRSRTKSANSTDNEVELEETHAEAEAIDVESEKASEKGEDEDDLESTLEDKKAESNVEDEDEEGEEEREEEEEEEEGSVDDGDRSQSGEPLGSFKELLIEKPDLTGSESVPASPSSQVSLSSGDDPEAIQAQKTWKKSIMLVWRAAANHKYANVFLHPVTDDEAPGYHGVVFRPMDLTTIKKNIENGTIRTTSEFQRDMMLMFQNALMYNSADHDVYHMAEEMRDDVMEQIQSYIATQIMVQSSDRDSKMLRGHRTDVFHFFL